MRISTMAGAFTLATMIGGSALAAPLAGSYSINGAFVPTSLAGTQTTLGAAEALDFVPIVLPGDVVVPTPGVPGEFVVAQATLDFAHLATTPPTIGNIMDLSLMATGNANYPVPPIPGFQQVGDVTFDLTSMSLLNQDDEFLIVSGMGTFKRAGFDDTEGFMNLTAQTVGSNGFATFTWSSSQGAAPVPEPASVLLTGVGLLGAGMMMRRRRRS